MVAASPKARAIVEACRLEDRPLSPREITGITGLNRSTVRVYCSRLVSEGVLARPHYGYYCINRTYGVRWSAPRVHNLRLRWAPACRIPEHVEVEEVYGDVKIRVVFGSERSLVTCWISSDIGLNYAGCGLAIQRFKEIAGSRVGCPVLDGGILVSSCEFNEDFESIRLDGLSSVTVESFLGSLERIYNRDGGLRSEVRVRPDSLASVYALLKGGVTAYNVLQAQFMVTQRLESLIVTVKEQSRGIQELGKIFRALLDRIDKLGSQAGEGGGSGGG